MGKYLDLTGAQTFKNKLVNYIDENAVIVTDVLSNDVAIANKIFFYTGQTTSQYHTDTYYKCVPVNGQQIYAVRCDLGVGTPTRQWANPTIYTEKSISQLKYSSNCEEFFLYENGVRTPLVVYWYNSSSGTRTEETFWMDFSWIKIKDTNEYVSRDGKYFRYYPEGHFYLTEYRWEPVFYDEIPSASINNLFS